MTDAFPHPDRAGDGQERVERILSGPLNDLAARAARTAAPIFRQQAWTWRDVGVPDEPQIAATLQHLLETVEDDSSTRTGRFGVERFVEDGREVYSIWLTVGEIIGPNRSSPRRRTAPMAEARAELWRCPECGAAAWHSTAEYPLPGGPALCTHPTPIYERFVLADHSDALAEAIEQAERECFPQGSPRTNEGYYGFHRSVRSALSRFRQPTPASTGKESGE